MFKISSFNNSKISAIQTTRRGGMSLSPYDSMNMGINTADPEVGKNIACLKNQNNLPHSPMFLTQTHSNKVVEYNAPPKNHNEHEADACFTREKNTICAILTADCLPVLLSSKTEPLVAAIHCGWKGLHANIIKSTLNKIAVDAGQLQAWLGPCISYKAYEVSEELRTKFVKTNQELAHCFYQNKKGKWHADLKKIAVTQLNQLGITEISQSPFCTFENNSLFYSYRKQPETGRMASMIWLND